jgi:hypothetical protein
MRIMPTPVALLGIALLGGCAAAQSSSAAPPLEPDCSFRSASTCWTVAGRFPARRPKSTPSKPDEIRDPSPAAVASTADPSKDNAPVTELQGVGQYSGRMSEPSPVLTIQVHVVDTTERSIDLRQLVLMLDDSVRMEFGSRRVFLLSKPNSKSFSSK